MKIPLVPQISKDGNAITSVETWFQHAPPKRRESHWGDGRSAKELAKAWFPTPGQARIPDELSSLLLSHVEFANIEIATGFPEVSIPLDKYPGGTRNADLVLMARSADEVSVITVEAKADESFAMTIGKKLLSAKKDSNIPKRIEHLSQAVFGKPLEQDPCLEDLRYQLLHAIAATLVKAQSHHAARALFIVHEFATTKTINKKRQANHNDMVKFLGVMSGGIIHSLSSGVIVGPFNVPGGMHILAGIPLFVAKITREY